MSRYTLFISDLHLHAESPDTTDYFSQLLTQQASRADALYILGDLFELWIGDDDRNPFINHIAKLFNDFQEKYQVPVYLMQGNRDVLLGQQFASACQATLLADPSLIDLYGQPVLLTHGDQLCTDDKSHQIYRKLTHSRPIRWLFLHLPLRYRQWIAKRLREKSTRRNASLPGYIMDVTVSAVTELMQAHKITELIHGHTHRPAIHHMELADRVNAKRYVLGAWHEGANGLFCYADQTKELVHFSGNK